MAQPDGYRLSRNPAEVQRLADQHNVYIQNLGYLIHPKIAARLGPNPRIGDVATGSGVWLEAAAKVYGSSAQYDGFDISDKQFPPAQSRMENMNFHVVNAKQPFPAQWKGQFDLVNLRLMTVAMTKDDWALVAGHVHELLKPGGAIQWLEANFTELHPPVRAQVDSSDTVMRDATFRACSPFFEIWKYGPLEIPKAFENLGMEDVFQDSVSSDRVTETRPIVSRVGMGALFQVLESFATQKVPGAWTLEECKENHQKTLKEIEAGTYIRWNLHTSIGFKAKA